jgi:DNA-binding NarL/FixJ family response regulator
MSLSPFRRTADSRYRDQPECFIPFRSWSRSPGQDAHLAGHTLEGLTDRELEVLVLVARGLSNAEIAQHLTVSPATAKTHVARLLMKLGARDQAQLIVVAYESGLVTPGPRPF